MELCNSGSDGKVLAESRNYYLKAEYEEVYLCSKSSGIKIAKVGDFYGDPSDGVIDVNERFCVTVGCGYIIYFLREPFESYEYEIKTSQLAEWGRYADNIIWIKAVKQTGGEVEITLESGETQIIGVMDNDERNVGT